MGDCLEAISKHTLIPRLLTPKDLFLSLWSYCGCVSDNNYKKFCFSFFGKNTSYKNYIHNPKAWQAKTAVLLELDVP